VLLCTGIDVQVFCLGSAGLRRLHRLCRLLERSASCVRSVARCLELKRDMLRQLSCERDATSKHGRQFVLDWQKGRGWGTGETGEISLKVAYNVQSICYDFKERPFF
jgi:hypothetical protein